MEGETRLRRGGDWSTEGDTRLRRGRLVYKGGGSSRDYTRCYWICLEWPEQSMCIIYISSFKFNILFHFTYKYTQCCNKRIIYLVS